MGKLTEEAQERKIAELKGTKLKIDQYGKLITEDSDGNTLSASLIFKNGELIITKEYIKFLAKKSKIKSVIEDYYKKTLTENIIASEDFYTYILSGEKGIPLLSITFRISKHGWIRTHYKLEMDRIIDTKTFDNTQQNSIVAVLNSYEKFIEEDLKREPFNGKIKCIIKTRTNI